VIDAVYGTDTNHADAMLRLEMEVEELVSLWEEAEKAVKPQPETELQKLLKAYYDLGEQILNTGR
jgi:hypothetical protein